MINIDSIRELAEIRLISYLLIEPKNVNKIITTNPFHNTTYAAICNILMKNKFHATLDRYTTMQYLMSYDKTIRADYDLDMIYQSIEEHKPSWEEAKGALFKIIETDKTRIVLEQLELAIDTIKKGYVKDGISQLKDIHYISCVDLPSSNTLMKAALMNTHSFKTGIHVIDENLGGYELGNLMTIGGDSGTMKTMSSMWMIIQFLIKNPEMKALYFEKEMSKYDMGRRMLQYYLRVNNQQIRKKDFAINGNNIRDITWAIKYIDEPDIDNKQIKDALDRLIIVPDNTFDSAYDMYEIIDYERPQIWCLDFITMLGQERMDDNYFAYVSKQVGIMKSMVKETNTLGIILSQIGQNKIKGYKNRIPESSDFEWGNKLKQYSSYIYTTFYPSKANIDRDVYGGIKLNPAWYYLIPLKMRGDEMHEICLHANPSFCDFTEQTGHDRKRQLEWLKNYRENEKDK